MKKYTILLAITMMLSTVISCSGENLNIDSNETDENGLLIDNDTTRINSGNMNIKIGNTTLTVALADNSSVDALKSALKEAPITIKMRDYGNMEKVGSLGRSFPRNDESITTEAGDVILYQGNALVIYYAPNSWSFTRLGKIKNISQSELKNILGTGNVTVTLSLSEYK